MRQKGNGRGASIFERIRRSLRGRDRALAPALPVGEAMHPVTLAAVALLLFNDWIAKPHASSALAAVTGKLSDLAGLAFAPVVLSALLGLCLHAAARLGARLDPSLSRRRLLLCLLATGATFAALKLSPALAALAGRSLALLGLRARFVADLTDLFTLPALLIPLWIGRDELRRIPLGRAAAILRLHRAPAPALADLRWAGTPDDRVADLTAALDARDAVRVDAVLAQAVRSCDDGSRSETAR